MARRVPSAVWFLTLVVALGAADMAAAGMPTGSTRIAGFKVSTPVVSGLDVQVDLTAYALTNPSPEPDIIGGKPLDFYYMTNRTTTADFGYGYAPTVYNFFLKVDDDWFTTAPPALDFGDAEVEQTIVLGLAPLAETDRKGKGFLPPVNVYRGSFVHSYDLAGTYNIKAKLGPDGQFAEPGLGPATISNVAYPPTTGTAFVGTLAANKIYSISIFRTIFPSSPLRLTQSSGIQSYPSTIQYIENSVPGVTVDAIPEVKIDTPLPNANFGSVTMIRFAASAMDDEDGDLGASLAWNSSIDGPLNTGVEFFDTLSPGMHTITASVMDSFGNVGQAVAMVNVINGGPGFSIGAGLCPGMLTLQIVGVAPGDKVAFFTGDAAGQTVVGGACAGAVIDIDNAQLRSTRFADGGGQILINRFFSLNQCGIMMQAINLGAGGSACQVSNPLQAPPPPEPPEPPVNEEGGILETRPPSSRPKQ